MRPKIVRSEGEVISRQWELPRRVGSCGAGKEHPFRRRGIGRDIVGF